MRSTMRRSRCIPVDLVHEHAITPLMGLLGECWSQHRGGIAEEHSFSTYSNYLRNKLGARLHHHSPTVLSHGLPALVREALVPVLVGETCAREHASAVESAGAMMLGHSVHHALARIDALLGAARPAPA